MHQWTQAIARPGAVATMSAWDFGLRNSLDLADGLNQRGRLLHSWGPECDVVPLQLHVTSLFLDICWGVQRSSPYRDSRSRQLTARGLVAAPQDFAARVPLVSASLRPLADNAAPLRGRSPRPIEAAEPSHDSRMNDNLVNCVVPELQDASDSLRKSVGPDCCQASSRSTSLTRPKTTRQSQRRILISSRSSEHMVKFLAAAKLAAAK